MDEVKKYAFTTVLDASFEEALTRIRDASQSEGFGIITEIDVKAILKKKLNKEFRKYMILGVCNPLYAYRSLTVHLDVGLLLPCNVIVYETDDGKSFISVMNPVSALEVIQSKELRDIADEVSIKLKDVIEHLQRTGP